MPERLFATPLQATCILVTFTLLVRLNVMGDPNYHIDEAFYLLVAQRMHLGDLLYVDIWDRKPPGIFVIYYLIGAVASGMLAVHIAAAISVGISAVLIFRLARMISGPGGAGLAACCYVALVGRFAGAGAQTPVFYNSFMLGAVWLVASRLPRLERGEVPRVLYGAMLLAGCALAVKPVAACEGALIGVWILWSWRKAMPVPQILLRGAALALTAALPLAACFAWYVAIGHLPDMWDAVVLSNFRRTYLTNESVIVLGVIAALLALPVGIATLSTWFNRAELRISTHYQLLFAWLVAAAAAFLAFPNKADHYVLPLLPPLAVAMAPFLNRRDFGAAVGLYIIAAYCITGDTFSIGDRSRSRAEMASAAAFVREHQAEGPFFIHVGPPWLYAATKLKPLSPLAFPPHLFDLTEYNVSQFDTTREVEQILARRPATVITQKPIPVLDENPRTTAMVRRYTARCAARHSLPVRDMYGPYRILVFTGCGRDGL